MSHQDISPGIPRGHRGQGEGNPYGSGILSVRKLPLVPDTVGFLLPSPCILHSLSQAADSGMTWTVKYLTLSEA